MIMRVITRHGTVIDTDVTEFNIKQNLSKGDIVELEYTPTVGKTKMKYIRLDDVVSVLRVERGDDRMRRGSRVALWFTVIALIVMGIGIVMSIHQSSDFNDRCDAAHGRMVFNGSGHYTCVDAEGRILFNE